MSESVKRPSPLSIRLSEQERALLVERAGNHPLGSYVKGILFEQSQISRRRRAPSNDARLLAQIIAVLGRSRIAYNLDALASAARSGSLGLDEETTRQIHIACGDVHLVRKAVMQALGKSGAV